MVPRETFFCCLATLSILMLSSVSGIPTTNQSLNTTKPLSFFDGGQLGNAPFLGPAFLTDSNTITNKDTNKNFTIMDNNSTNNKAVVNVTISAVTTKTTPAPGTRWNPFNIHWCPDLWSTRQPRCEGCTKDNDCGLGRFCCRRALAPFPFWRCCS